MHRWRARGTKLFSWTAPATPDTFGCCRPFCSLQHPEGSAMYLRSVIPPSLLCLAWLTAPAAQGDAPRFDRYGDPLPPVVIARLGTERLTLADTTSELTFSPDG